ncbi:MAG: hypothetical protein ABGY75_21365, partial [Gemmataceae bacterium]
MMGGIFPPRRIVPISAVPVSIFSIGKEEGDASKPKGEAVSFFFNKKAAIEAAAVHTYDGLDRLLTSSKRARLAGPPIRLVENQYETGGLAVSVRQNAVLDGNGNRVVTTLNFRGDPYTTIGLSSGVLYQLNDRAVELDRQLPKLDAQIELAKEELGMRKKEYQEALDAPAPDGLEKAVRESDADYLKAAAVAKKLVREAAAKQSEVNNPSSEAVRRAQERAEVAEVEAEKILRKKVAEANAVRRKPVEDEVQGRLKKAESILRLLSKERELAVAELARTRKELVEIPNPPEGRRDQANRDRQISADATALLMLDETYASLTKRLLSADLDVNTPDRVVVQQAASTPMQKDTNKQILATVFAGALGFVAVAGLMVLLEMRARKVSSLAELKGSAPTAVVGVVPWLPDAATARDPARRAEVNEAIDKLRSYVAQTWLARGATTVTVTSPLGDEGKGFTAFGLASSLAQAGYKTLLADFDLRNPALHAYAGVGNELGVCELLRGEADFRRTIQVLPNGLHFLTAGKWTDEARQAAVGGRLEALLGRL